MSDSPLKQKFTEAMKDAMRAKDKPRLGTIRLALSEIKRVEVDERIDPDDGRIIGILDKMVKQRRESIKQFEAAQRAELVAQEAMEIGILQEFLPQALSETELGAIIQKALVDSGAADMKDMGKVMGLTNSKLAGKADGKTISGIVKKMLSN